MCTVDVVACNFRSQLLLNTFALLQGARLNQGARAFDELSYQTICYSRIHEEGHPPTRGICRSNVMAYGLHVRTVVFEESMSRGKLGEASAELSIPTTPRWMLSSNLAVQQS